jgi:hypothetical protein
MLRRAKTHLPPAADKNWARSSHPTGVAEICFARPARRDSQRHLTSNLGRGERSTRMRYSHPTAYRSVDDEPTFFSGNKSSQYEDANQYCYRADGVSAQAWPSLLSSAMHYCYCSCLNSLVGLRTPLSRPSERQKVGSAYLSRCSDFAPENFSGYFLAASMATPATRDQEHLRSHHGWRLPKLPGVPERELRSCGRAASAASSRRFRQCLHRSSPPNHQTPTIALTLRLWRKHPDYGGKQWQVSEQNKSSSQLDAR